MFRSAEVALVRAPVLAHGRIRDTWVEPPDAGAQEADEARWWAGYVTRLGSDPRLREAVALASPSLAQLVAEVCAGRPVEPRRLRRAAFSLTRYQLRMASRATPFGLFAGVAAAGFAETAAVRLGTAHRAAVRPDMGWLSGLLADLESRPQVLAGLRVVANDLAFARGGRLVLPYVPERHAAGGASAHGGASADGSGSAAGGGSARVAVEVSVRRTAAVRAAVELAATPVPFAELVRLLSERFPGATAQVVDGLLRRLVEREFLLTELRPPAGATDPLAHLLALLPDGPERTELAAAHAELTDGSEALSGAARQRRERAAERLRTLRAADRLLQTDLALDAEIQLPAAVAAEAERTAAALWRMSPARPVPHLAQYHLDFLNRYGAERLVPLRELLDPDVGLGAPAGYLLPPSERELPGGSAESEESTARRDALRIELAQEALLTGRREVVLDDALVDRLSPSGPLAPPASTELYAQLLAHSPEALTAGRFRLWMTPGAGADQAGATIGRFSHLLPEAARRTALACHEAETAPAGPGSATGQGSADGQGTDRQSVVIGAQLALRTVFSRSANLSQVPRRLDHHIVVGAFADPREPGVLRLDDLAVGADLTRLHLVRLSTGQRVVPLAWNMLNPQAQVANLGRFLRELRLSGVRPGNWWDWGPLSAAPYTPRVRYGRTVLAPARWRPTAGLFADTAAPEADWRRRFERWRERWGVPEQVLLSVADRGLELNLTAGLHLRLLRQEIAREPQAVLYEAPAGADGHGWLGGEQGAHVAEVVIPLLGPVRPAPAGEAVRRPERSVRPVAAGAPARPRVVAPGGDWLYLKLYGSTRRQDELLTGQLPRLLAELPAGVDRWFFLRYRDPDPHLRLRFHGDPAKLNGQLLPVCRDWFAELRRAGLAGRLVLDGYEPEWERYGGPAAMPAAEQAFCADSAAVLAQLGASAAGRLGLAPTVLGALNMLDILRHVHGEVDAEEWLLARYPRTDAHREVRGARALAARLGDPRQDWAALRAHPGGPELLAVWQRRAGALARYGELLRSTAGARGPAGGPGLDDPCGRPLTALLHLHHNRLLGVDREAEGRAQAIARGAVAAQRGRVN